MTHNVVITGIGCVSPIGIGREAFWTALGKGNSGIGPIRKFDVSRYPCQLGAEIRGFDPSDILGKKGLRYLNSGSLSLASAVALVLEDAKNPNISEAGTVIGFGFGNSPQTMDYTVDILKQGPSELLPMASFDVALNASVNYISVRFHLAGLSRSISSGTTSGLDAIGNAYQLIQKGRARIIISGGIDQLSLDNYLIFNNKKFLAPLRADTIEQEIPKPFDKKRNGMILGEGSCVFIVEDEENAKSRSACIYGRILGYDTVFIGGASEEVIINRSSSLLSGLLKRCELTSSQIDVVVGFANRGQSVDRIEAFLLGKAFPHRVPVVVVKSLIGETYGASGAFQLASAMKGICTGMLFPSNIKEPEFDIDIVMETPRQHSVKHALIHSLDTEGNYTALIAGAI